MAVLSNLEPQKVFYYFEEITKIPHGSGNVDQISDFLVDFAKEMSAGIVVRGLRAVTDFEYELQMAQTNNKLSPELETVFLTTSLEYSYLSSTIVKEVAAFGGDISQFVPETIERRIQEKIMKRRV